jgi:hypothetical protein
MHSIGLCQESCLKNAWDAFNLRNWKLAIQNAEDCIFNFNSSARQKQKELESMNYKLPLNFTIPKALSAQQKNEIFSHGLLNDVAVSYWIIGMANQRLGNTDKSIIAFQEALKLTYALCYDSERDFFWSISEDSKQRLLNK